MYVGLTFISSSKRRCKALNNTGGHGIIPSTSSVLIPSEIARASL